MVMRMSLYIHKAIYHIQEDQFCLVIIIVEIQVYARMEFLKYTTWEHFFLQLYES